MSRMKSIFDGRYFRYSARKILPLTVSVNIIMIISSFFYYMTGSSLLFGEVSDFSAVLSVFSFVFPLLLAFVLFKFVFSKKQTDMIGSFPIKRGSLFFTNAVLAASVIAVTVLLGILSSVLTRVFVCGNNIYIAWQIFFYMFFFWFAAYFAMFLIAAVGCMLTGNIISAVIISASIMCSLDLCVLILNAVINNSITFVFSFMPPFQVLYNMIADSSYLYHSVWYIVYSLFFCAVMLLLGMYCSKVRKYETAENLFVNKAVLTAVRFGVYLPVCGLFWVLVKESAAWELLLLFITVGFFVFEVILNRGIRKHILRGLAVFGISAAVALLVYIPYGLRYMNSYENEISFDDLDITEITVSVPRLNEYILNDYKYGYSYNRDDGWVDLKITDGEVLSLIEEDIERSYIKSYIGSDISRVVIECQDSSGEYRYLYGDDISEKLKDKIAECLYNDEEFMKKFFWEDFGSDGHGMFVFAPQNYSTSVMHGIICKRENRSDYSEENIKNILKDCFSLDSQINGNELVYNREGAAIGVYFKNGRYYIRASECRNKEEKNEILKEINSKFSDKKGNRIDLLTFDRENPEIEQKLEIINSDDTGSYINALDISALKNGDVDVNDCIVIFKRTFGNFYEFCFAPKNDVLKNFNGWYDKRAENSVENIGSAYNYHLSVCFEKFYTGSLGVFSSDKSSYGKFAEFAEYYMTYEEYCNLPDRNSLCFSLDFYIGGSIMTLYIPINEKTVFLLSEIEQSGGVRSFGADDGSLSKFVGSDFSDIESIIINGINITDRDDIGYIAKGMYLQGTNLDNNYMYCDCFYFSGEYNGETYDEEELYDRAESVGTIVLTGEMLEFLDEKYGIVSGSDEDSKLLFTVVIKQR